jgi:beta-lactamase regulating signal transducer with metallopeptidase domain
MTFLPIMLSVWGLTVIVMAAMLLYRSRLSRDEEDQLFLDDSFNQQKSAQAEIAARVQKVQPMVKGSEFAAGFTTLILVGYFLIDMYKNLFS